MNLDNNIVPISSVSHKPWTAIWPLISNLYDFESDFLYCDRIKKTHSPSYVQVLWKTLFSFLVFSGIKSDPERALLSDLNFTELEWSQDNSGDTNNLTFLDNVKEKELNGPQVQWTH